MTVAVKESLHVSGDWLIREPEDIAYTRSSYAYTNSSGATKVFPSGNPMAAGVPLAILNAGNQATMTGLLLNTVIVPDTETRRLCVVERGHCVIDTTIIAALLLPGAVDLAQLKIALARMGFLYRDEPGQVEIQEMRVQPQAAKETEKAAPEKKIPPMTPPPQKARK